MEKKSKREVGKLVEAKVKGKKTRKSLPTDDSTPAATEVDVRNSKMYEWIKA
ncbi:MAG: hypothetical protein NVS9B1_23130 [Candidatus Dormibacteraceae bacterium]